MTGIRLSAEDVKLTSKNAYDEFLSGIKSDETRRIMVGNLKQFLNVACADLLTGTIEERAEQFVDISKKNQDEALGIILGYLEKLKLKCRLDKTDPDYLNPSSVPNKIKPIRKLLDENGIGLAWKRVHNRFPELDNTTKGRGYTREEIKKMLEYSPNLELDFIILAESSGGFRVGSWSDLKWSSVYPLYEDDNTYTKDPKNSNARIVCAAITVYEKTPEQYDALISTEAWEKLQEYKTKWTNKVGRSPVSSDYLLLSDYKKLLPITDNAIRQRIHKLRHACGITPPLTEGNRRYEVPTTHGFRRYYDKVMLEVKRNSDQLSTMTIKERLMGHTGVVPTDKNYYHTDIADLVKVYLVAMPELMISDEYRLQNKLDDEKKRADELEQASKDKDAALEKMKELEAKVDRMSRFRST